MSGAVQSAIFVHCNVIFLKLDHPVVVISLCQLPSQTFFHMGGKAEFQLNRFIHS